MTAAVIVSLCALIFTVASFWWLHARSGQLRMSSVTAFSGWVGGDKTILFRLPVLLYNSGAKTRVVDELRLVFPDWNEAVGAWEHFTDTLKPKSENLDFASPFAIDGRRTENKFVTFSIELEELPRPDSTQCIVQARLDGSDDWTELKSFILHLPHMHTPSQYKTWRNSKILCEGEPAKTIAAWQEISNKWSAI